MVSGDDWHNTVDAYNYKDYNCIVFQKPKISWHSTSILLKILCSNDDNYFIYFSFYPLFYFVFRLHITARTFHSVLDNWTWLWTSRVQFSQTYIRRPFIWIIFKSFYVVAIWKIHLISIWQKIEYIIIYQCFR
jgi:hypothetical protein